MPARPKRHPANLGLLLALPAAIVLSAAGCTSSATRTRYRQHLQVVVQPVANDDRDDVMIAFGRFAPAPTAAPTRTALGGSASLDPGPARPTLHLGARPAYDRALPATPVP